MNCFFVFFFQSDDTLTIWSLDRVLAYILIIETLGVSSQALEFRAKNEPHPRGYIFEFSIECFCFLAVLYELTYLFLQIQRIFYLHERPTPPLDHHTILLFMYFT